MKTTPFSEDTESIISLLSDDSTINCLPPVKRVELSKKILSDIFVDISNAYKKIKKLKKSKGTNFISIETFIIQDKKDIPVPITLGLSTIPKNVREHIENESSSLITFRSQLGERKIQVKFIIDNKDPSSHISMYTKYFEKMLIWLSIAFEYSSSKCGKDISIHIYPTPIVKTLPTKNTDVIGIHHANTAFTHSCPSNLSEIIIFRREEWFKVFIHETFHMLGLDFSGMYIDYAKQIIGEIFPVQSSFKIYESYTETWAIVINVCFCSYFCIEDRPLDKDLFIDYTELLLGFEIAWKMFQMQKILRFMGLRYKDLHDKSTKSTVLRNNLYRENTNILAYYIITAVLLSNYPIFFKWCNVHNMNTISFDKKKQNIIAFANLIKELYNNDTTNKMIKKTGSDKCFYNIKNYKDTSSWIPETMRMSVCEFK